MATDGTVLDPDGFVIANGPPSSQYQDTQPTVAFDGTNFRVAWVDEESSPYAELTARVSSAGIVLDPDGVLLPSIGSDEVTPTIACTGGKCLVSFEDSGAPDLGGVRLNAKGAVVDTTPLAIGQGTGVMSTFDGTNYQLATVASSGSVGTIRVSPEGDVLDSPAISVAEAADQQTNAAAAFDGTNYMVVWNDTAASSTEAYGAPQRVRYRPVGHSARQVRWGPHGLGAPRGGLRREELSRFLSLQE